MSEHYLDAAIAELSAKAKVTNEAGGSVLVRGPQGSSRVVKKRCYWFDLGSETADEWFDYKSHRAAMYAALEWAVTGKL